MDKTAIENNQRIWFYNHEPHEPTRTTTRYVLKVHGGSWLARFGAYHRFSIVVIGLEKTLTKCNNE